MTLSEKKEGEGNRKGFEVKGHLISPLPLRIILPTKPEEGEDVEKREEGER